jgi:hypothetical protein
MINTPFLEVMLKSWMGSLKKTTLCLSVLFLITFTPLLFPVSSNSSNPSVNLFHVIEVKNGGLMVVNDTVTIENTGNEPISSFKMGIPSGFKENVDHVSFRSQQGEVLNLLEDVSLGGDGIYGFEVEFPEPVNIGETYVFTMTCVYSDTIWSEVDYGICIAIFPKYPSLPFEAVECNSSIIVQDEVTVYDSIWGGLKSNITSPLPAFNNETGFVSFSEAIYLIGCDWAIREIIIDSSARINFKDTYHLTNMGSNVLSSLTFTLPRDAGDMVAYDTFFGEIEVTSKKYSEQTVATVTFRHPGITPSYLELTPPGNYTFTLSYSLPALSHLTQTDMWNYRFEMLFFENFEYVIRDLTVKISPPEGAEFVSYSNLEGEVIKESSHQTLTYALKDVTPFDDLNTVFEYKYVIFWAAYRPVLWLGFTIAIIGAIVILRRRGEPTAPSLPAKDMRVLHAFTDVSSEISALRTDLKSLEEEYDQKRIRKKLYRRRKRTLQQQLHRSSRALQSLKKEVMLLDPRLKDVVHQIEVAETELETMHSNAQKIKIQYHSGRISRKAYEDLLEEYEKRSNDAQRSIDEAIMKLRSELR